MRVGMLVRLVDAARRRFGAGVATMSLEEIQAARVSRIPSVPGLDPLLRRFGAWLLGTARADVRISTIGVPVEGATLHTRVYTPPQVAANAPLVVFLHGGGWVLGSPPQYDWLCSETAARVGAVVASVDYRKAPEHPAPTPVRDAIGATRWLAAHADRVGAPGPLAVMGDSAGGNLATLVAIDARDHAGPAIAHQALIYPGVDLTRSFPSIRELADAPILPSVDIDAFFRHYLRDGADPADPELSPWFVEDLSGLPPALVQIAEHDPLRDEDRAYAARLADAGVAVRATEYVGVPHGFVSLPGPCRPQAQQALAEIVQELRAHLL